MRYRYDSTTGVAYEEDGSIISFSALPHDHETYQHVKPILLNGESLRLFQQGEVTEQYRQPFQEDMKELPTPISPTRALPRKTYRQD